MFRLGTRSTRTPPKTPTMARPTPSAPAVAPTQKGEPVTSSASQPWTITHMTMERSAKKLLVQSSLKRRLRRSSSIEGSRSDGGPPRPRGTRAWLDLADKGRRQAVHAALPPRAGSSAAAARRGFLTLSAEPERSVAVSALPERGVHDVQGMVDVAGGYPIVGCEPPSPAGSIALDATLLDGLGQLGGPVPRHLEEH